MNTLLLFLVNSALAGPTVSTPSASTGAPETFVMEISEDLSSVGETATAENFRPEGWTPNTAPLPSGSHVRAYGGRLELEASLGADGVDATKADVVFAQTSPSEIRTKAFGRISREKTAVTGWVSLSEGETRLARRTAMSGSTVCAEREATQGPERDLDLRLTRTPPSGEQIALDSWKERPSFVMGDDDEGLTGVYSSLQPGDQITVVQISGGTRYLEEVELTRTGRSLRWRRDHKSESVCYEEAGSE